MFELIKAGGWLMIPILLCSVIMLAIIAERLWFLQRRHVLPDDLVEQLISDLNQEQVNSNYLVTLANNSTLGQVLSKALTLAPGTDQSRRLIEDAGRHAVHNLEKYLNMLGTIAVIAPLLGLLGTVVGMIDVFSTLVMQGVGNAQALAGGISSALITTAAGLTVAIPAVVAHRLLQRRIDVYAINLEEETAKFLERLPRAKPARTAA